MQTRTLTDGTAVWMDPMRDVESVALGVTVKGGSADEAPETLGSTHFLEHLLFKRTRRRSGAAIARMTDRLGGDCDAYTTKESVCFHARTPASRLTDAISLLLDLTEAPAFTRDDVELERDVILEEMADANDVPEDRLHDAFVRALWPAHPLGAPILGTEETVRGLSRDTLVARFREIFRPERMVIVAAGAFEPEALVTQLQRARDLRTRRAKAPTPLPPRRAAPSPRAARCAFHLVRPDLTQTHLLIGSPGLAFGHPLITAATLASVILGGGVSSRLWRGVRERQGLAYHVGSGLTVHRRAGVFLIEAATQPKNLPKLVKTTRQILRRILSDGVTPAELVRAKNQVTAEIALSLESTAARREAAARSWLYRGRPEEVSEVLARVGKVTVDDVAKSVQLLFASSMGLGITGPVVPGISVDELVGELAA